MIEVPVTEVEIETNIREVIEKGMIISKIEKRKSKMQELQSNRNEARSVKQKSSTNLRLMEKKSKQQSWRKYT